MHNFLPTFANLQQRRLLVRNLCPLCESNVDTTAHLVLSCPIAHQILDSVGLPPVPILQNLDLSEILAIWFMRADKRHRSLIVLTCWAIWYARNELVHDGTACSINKASTFILAFLHELETVEALSVPAKVSKDVKWYPPVDDTIKINFDVSFNPSSKSSAFGIIARDSHGLVMAACSHPHSEVADAFIAKAIACERAVSFAADLGFRSVQIEGDSLSVIKKLTSATTDRSIISPIINDIRIQRNLFERITFSFVGRAGNAAAHELAKLGSQFSEPMYWIEEVPTVVDRIVQRDHSP
ncbi:hypothetical protein V6N12_060966 [Hibiscus sabdariffa]|uniref:RNase H type-1 domain-containing protein n=1 Tax=Hibiscus sabdariffa TaxID=183260 RepID=A0ABR2DVN3_9ROSI